MFESEEPASAKRVGHDYCRLSRLRFLELWFPLVWVPLITHSMLLELVQNGFKSPWRLLLTVPMLLVVLWLWVVLLQAFTKLRQVERRLAVEELELGAPEEEVLFALKATLLKEALEEHASYFAEITAQEERSEARS